MRTMLSGWLKNLMASVYRAKSLVCCVWETERGGGGEQGETLHRRAQDTDDHRAREREKQLVETKVLGRNNLMRATNWSLVLCLAEKMFYRC